MKKIFMLISLLIACFSLSFLITSYAYNKDSTKYIISDYNGKLAVFKEDLALPENIYNIYISSFSEEEQSNLKEGIKINNENELQELLEAYLS